jgi:hypothetical protein
LIRLIGIQMQKIILERVKAAKWFGIIVDE